MFFRIGPMPFILKLSLVLSFQQCDRQLLSQVNSPKGVDFGFESGQLVLAGQSAESGQSRVEMPLDHSGDTVEIKLDPRFVSEFLRVLDPATSLDIEITDGQSACVCRTEDGYGYCVMPVGGRLVLVVQRKDYRAFCELALGTPNE